MRIAVAKFIGKHEKEPTQALLDLRAHYQFTHRFCNAYKGNEKGHVERSVEYVRRKSFGHKHQFTNEQEAEKHLHQSIERINNTIQQLTEKTACELFGEEKSYLRTFLQPMECSQMEELRVDKYATISFKTNRYSVPEKLVGEFVYVKVCSHKLEIYHHNSFQAKHTRTYGKHEWIIDINHYLDTFKAKPGALANSTALISNVYLKGIYDKYFEHQPRAFIDLLQYCYSKQIDQDQFATTLDKLQLNHRRGEVNTDAFIVLLGNYHDPKANHRCDEPSTIQEFSKQHLIKVTNLMCN
jgi:hypothetical protein